MMKLVNVFNRRIWAPLFVWAFLLTASVYHFKEFPVEDNTRARLDPEMAATVAAKNKTLVYEYTWNNLKGLPFHPHTSALSAVGFPLKNFIKLSDSTLEDFVFTTALNHRFASRSLESLATIQEHFPRKKIILYDLGLNREVIPLFRSLCNVEYRKFDFESFPKHVKANLKNYSWKFLVIHAVLQEYPGVFWVDASVRFSTDQMESAFGKVRETGGISFFVTAGHSNYAVMRKETQSYLKTDTERQKTTKQAGATAILIYRTQEIYEHVIRWAVLCSLKGDCIGRGTVNCDFRGDDKYAHCSRYDQTVVNILCSNYFGFNPQQYTADFSPLGLQRRLQGHAQPAYCRALETPLLMRTLTQIL